MWFIGVEVEQETSALPPKKNPGSAPDCIMFMCIYVLNKVLLLVVVVLVLVLVLLLLLLLLLLLTSWFAFALAEI